jgi:hypothetical protein
MFSLLMIGEAVALFALGFRLAAAAQGTSRVRDWAATSPYPRRGGRRDASA